MIQYKIKLISNAYQKDNMTCSKYTRYITEIKERKRERKVQSKLNDGNKETYQWNINNNK